MKKTLSVLLAVLMIFSALSVGASAANYPNDYFGDSQSGRPANYDQAVLRFDLNGGTMKQGAYVWNGTEFVYETGITGEYVMLPTRWGVDMKAGNFVSLPTVVPPANQQFDGWFCYRDHQAYGSFGNYMIPNDLREGEIIEFRASFSPTVVEEDTMVKVMGILSKVFGTIIGMLFYGGDAEVGIKFVEDLLGGLF